MLKCFEEVVLIWARQMERICFDLFKEKIKKIGVIGVAQETINIFQSILLINLADSPLYFLKMIGENWKDMLCEQV